MVDEDDDDDDEVDVLFELNSKPKRNRNTSEFKDTVKVSNQTNYSMRNSSHDSSPNSGVLKETYFIFL